MNILSITGILPVPGIKKTNDFLIPLYKTYLQKYPEDQITFIRLYPEKLFSEYSRKLRHLKSYNLEGFNVILYPYFATWRFVNIHSLISSITSFLFNRKKIGIFLKNNKTDIIHAEFIIPDGYLAYRISKIYGIPYVLTTHSENRYFDSFMSKKVTSKILQKASYVTPLNYTSAAIYIKHGAGKTQVIPHGIDENFLNAMAEYKTDQTVKILSVAALFAYKNLDKVLMAVAELKNFYSIRYTIIGSGPEKQAIDRLIDSLGINDVVNCIDKIPYENIPQEMSKYDIFILPSYFETFGRVLFEAMAVGLPVICAKDTGIHGYFTEGIEAFSVRHDDIQDITSKLKLLINDPIKRKIMGQKAKELMRNYTWDNVVDSFHAIYISILK